MNAGPAVMAVDGSLDCGIEIDSVALRFGEQQSASYRP